MLQSADYPIIWFEPVTFTNLAFYYTLGYLKKSGLELDYSRCAHEFKSRAYFVIVLINKFEIIGFHMALSSTYGRFFT